MNRRDFLKVMHLAPAALLGGCSLGPDSRWWEILEAAEHLDRALARPFAHRLAKTYPRSAWSTTFPERSLALADGYAEGLAGWRLEVTGLVEKPIAYTLPELMKAFPKHAETTRHDCVEGWSAIAEFGGVRVADLLAAVRPRPEARWVVFHAADFDEATGAPYYGSLALLDAAHPQAVLAYEMNGEALTVRHGAPLRLRVPTQLGYKSTKFVHRVELRAELAGLGRGKGGYWEDAGYAHWAGI